MEFVVTKASKLECSHTGKVNPMNIQSVLKVNGNDVLVGSLKGNISNCTQTTSPVKPCTVVIDIQAAGEISNVLSVNGNAVLLKTATGTTNGNPPGTWSVISTEQKVLQAD
jgi:hypothetical protein